MCARTRHLSLGAAGEEAAASFLRELGWRIVARNWRPAGAYRGFELDVVAQSKGVLVFVEVKTRTVRKYAGQKQIQHVGLHVPVYAAFTHTKQARMVCAARHYLAEHGLWDAPCRFDLICVERSPDRGMQLEHLHNVIEFGNFVDSSNTAWQPW